MLKLTCCALILTSLATGVQAKQIRCADVDLEIIEKNPSLGHALRTGKIPDEILTPEKTTKEKSASSGPKKSPEEKLCEKLIKKENKSNDRSQKGQRGVKPL